MSEQRALYNSLDIAVTRRCFDELEKDLITQNQTGIYNLTMQLYPVLAYQSFRGLRVDVAALGQERDSIEAELSGLQAALNELCGRELNVSSTTQMRSYFYGELGIKPYVNRKTGEATLDDKALARIARRDAKGAKEARLCQSIRSLRKLKSSYFEVTLDRDQRLRCNWNPRGTKNIRLSSSQTMYGTGMNLQNIDPRFKKYIIPDDGYIFIELDKVQAERVITGFMSGDANMIHTIESGIDAHAFTGASICGVPIELAIKDDKLVGKTSDPDEVEVLRSPLLGKLQECKPRLLPRTMSIRQLGKKANHALNYRMNYPKFSLWAEIEEGEGKPIVDLYRDTYTGITRWWERQEQKLWKDRTIENAFGTKRRFFGDLRDPETINDAIAYGPQSTNAEMVNRAMVLMWNDPSPAMQMIDHLAQVHDSVFFQFPIDQWPLLAKAINRYQIHLTPQMRYEGREFIVKTDMKIGLNWGDETKDNPRGMTKLEITDDNHELATNLKTTYEKLLAL